VVQIEIVDNYRLRVRFFKVRARAEIEVADVIVAKTMICVLADLCLLGGGANTDTPKKKLF